MHENLKYTLNLDENIQEFKSFEKKQNENQQHKAEISDWQPIYSGTNYGTEYFIYSKFIGQVIDSGFQVNKIQSYLQNYKGSVSIGFNGYADITEVGIDGDDPDTDPRYPNRRKFVLKLGLQGLKMESITHEFIPKDLLLLHGDVLETNPLFTPANPEISRIFDANTHNNSNFVDEIFMQRMGDDIFIPDDKQDLLIDLLPLGLIAKQDLLNAGIDIDSEEVQTNYKLMKEVRAFGKEYPCIPKYSFCFCK